MSATIKYRILRQLVSGKTQYLTSNNAWTHTIAGGELMSADEAVRRMSEVKLSDATVPDPAVVIEYSIQPFSFSDPVPGPIASSLPPVFDPSVTVARQLVGPLGDALRLAAANGKTESFLALLAQGAPISVDEIISALN